MSRQKYSGRTKGPPNKVTTKVKAQLEHLLDACISSISIDDMSRQEKLKAIQICLQYLIPKPSNEGDDKDTVQQFEVQIIDCSERLNSYEKTA